jgi:hypothetical protein
MLSKLQKPHLLFVLQHLKHLSLIYRGKLGSAHSRVP